MRKWAYCFRAYSGLNTNMHLERMHGVIKYIYLKGAKPKRLNIALHALMTFLRDKLLDKLIAINKGKLTYKISCLRNRHKKSLELDPQNIVVGSDTSSWEMMSERPNEI